MRPATQKRQKTTTNSTKKTRCRLSCEKRIVPGTLDEANGGNVAFALCSHNANKKN
eukprot:TRINITY_DN1267_c0_g2_i1.p1 TRINITY_DN1267_c0_g2~~TRINITY_DN1267_c0_g2_i1.p1  ORF type:complete len:56 (+),score=9.43 TRINITY_DN1267_c0_g2_i1:389-556(+)